MNGWLRTMAHLRVDRATGDPAPHKPMLLLIVLDLAEQGAILDDRLELTPEIAFRFRTLWRVVAHRRTQRPDVRFPFHHLKSDGVWMPVQEDDEPSPHRRLTQGAVLEPSFAECIRSPEWRARARSVLIGTYFRPEERVSLRAMLELPAEEDDADAANLDARTTETARSQGRELRFRLAVVAAYSYTCALTSYRLTTIAGTSIVDAAHIHRFADSRNNDLDNGIALCKNAHWMFDNGLWTLNDDYTVRVAVGNFDESWPGGKRLYELDATRIALPNERSWWPAAEHIHWHRANVFLGRR